MKQNIAEIKFMKGDELFNDLTTFKFSFKISRKNI